MMISPQQKKPWIYVISPAETSRGFVPRCWSAAGNVESSDLNLWREVDGRRTITQHMTASGAQHWVLWLARGASHISLILLQSTLTARRVRGIWRSSGATAALDKILFENSLRNTNYDSIALVAYVELAFVVAGQDAASELVLAHVKQFRAKLFLLLTAPAVTSSTRDTGCKKSQCSSEYKLVLTLSWCL